MHTYAVGQPYVRGKAHWPEVVEFNFRGGANELRLFLSRPSQRKLAELATAPIDVAVAVHPPVTFLLWRCGTTFQWSDCPFSYHLVPKEEQVPPRPLRHDERAPLSVIAVSAEDGIVRVLRAVTLPNVVTIALSSAISGQSHQPFNQTAYYLSLKDLYRRYPTSDLLLKTAIAQGRVGT